jgi:spermidine/putrescine transport system substrate-binding protein
MHSARTPAEPPFDRRSFLRKMGLVAAALPAAKLLAACGEDEELAVGNGVDPDEIGGEIDFLSWEGYDLLEETAEWREQHGITINSSYIGANEDIHTRILSPGGDGIDLITYADGYGDQYRELEVVTSIDPDEIPNLEHMMSVFRDSRWFRNEDGTYAGIPFTWGGMGMNYRPDLLDTVPERWTDLLEPEFEGRVAMVDDMKGNVVLGARMLGYDPERLTQAQLEEVRDILIQMKRQAVAISPGFGDVTNLLVAGEASVVFMGWAAVNSWAEQEGVELGFLIPEEGSLTFVDAYAIPPTADNRETALAFINQALEPSVQVQQAQALSAGVVRDDVIDDLPPDIRDMYPYDDIDSFFEIAPLYAMPPQDREGDYVNFEDWVQMWQSVQAA